MICEICNDFHLDTKLLHDGRLICDACAKKLKEKEETQKENEQTQTN